MIDAMVKQLDPNHPAVRESLQNIVTINFAELVKIFPTVAFHSGTQRLAVGTLDGTSIIYDLRTATKMNILEVIYIHVGPHITRSWHFILS
jgi:WD40 repeat protein